MTAIYEVLLYDEDLEPQGELQGWEYLEFTQRINSPWNHAITIKASNSDSIATYLRNADGMVDWHVLVYRTDPVAEIKHLAYQGFNRTIVDQLDSHGNVIFNLYGAGFTELLTRRIVIPQPNQESLVITDFAESAMKQFVLSQAINPVDSDRIIVGLSNEVDSATGSTVTYSARYTVLSTVINKCAIDGNVDYGIVGGDPAEDEEIGTFEFQVRPLWGLDRTRDNTDGNNPTIFDITLGNMAIPIYSVNSSGEKNSVYVGGQGQGVNRTIYHTTNPDGLAKSPWNRREDFADARLESTQAGLITTAQEILYNYRIQRALTFNVIQTQGYRWIQNWDLGDLITAEYYGISQTQQITQINARISGRGGGQTETISVEFAEWDD